MSLYYAGRSLLHRLTPITKLALSFMAIAHMVAFPQLKFVALHMAACVLLLALSKPRIPVKAWLAALAVVVGHGWTSAALVKSGTPLIAVGWLKITDEGARLGLMLAARVLAILLYSVAVAATTNPRDLALSLVKLGVDYRYAFASYVTFRMAPLVYNDLVNILVSRRMRRLRGLRNPVESAAGILAPLLSLIAKRSVQLSISMESRAFGARRERAFYWEVRAGRLDYAFLASFAAYLALGTLLLG